MTDKNFCYGLIGHPLAHSLSPWIHRQLMDIAGLDYPYDLIDINPQDFLREMPSVLARFRGLNCTIPYKERVISLLDSLDSQAAALRSVNTILNSRGYNTDHEGFLNDGPDLYDRRILILGAGGVSRMLAFAAAGVRAGEIAVWSRRVEQSAALIHDLNNVYPGIKAYSVEDVLSLQGRSWVVLHGTPAGMWPHTDGLPLPEDTVRKLLGRTVELYDTVYNPVATRLVLMARSLGIRARGGLGMLFGQALAAQKIWHPQADFAEDDLLEIKRKLAQAVMSHFPVSLVFTGFMGSGKSTIGRLLSELTGLPLIDLDEAIEADQGRTISDIFAAEGEIYFRDLEHRLLGVCLDSGKTQIITTGGGALIAERNRELIRSKAALVIYLSCSLPEIKRRVGQGSGRPLWRDEQSDELQKLYDRRQNIYNSVADRVISADQEPERLAAQIAADFGLQEDNR